MSPLVLAVGCALLFVFQGCGLGGWGKEQRDIPMLLGSASLPPFLGWKGSMVTADLVRDWKYLAGVLRDLGCWRSRGTWMVVEE